MNEEYYNSLKENDMEIENHKSNKKLTKKGYASLKIDKEYKILFDELVHQHRTKQVDFLEELLEFWCKHNDEKVIQDFNNGLLPEQQSKN
ncbi:hypothetical protein BU064_13140 [Staphylococcus succinus]|nr:hypothetical protein BU064_13140 [Staphylococcus succinus]